MRESDSEKDVLYASTLFPVFPHHRAHCGLKPLMWQFNLTDVVRMLNKSIDRL